MLGLGEMHYLEHGRRDIAELAALAELAGIADNNERNGVRRVRGEGLAVVADHAVRVAVIRSDERYAALGSDEVNESATQASTASTALTAASNTPVWPTMSQFAKLRIIAS